MRRSRIFLLIAASLSVVLTACGPGVTISIGSDAGQQPEASMPAPPGSPAADEQTDGTSSADDDAPAPIPEQREYSGPAPAAGTGAISGRVLWNDEPVANAAVRLCEDVGAFSGCEGATFDTKTGDDGAFALTDVTPGEYTLMVKAPKTRDYVYARTLSMEGETLPVVADTGTDIGDFPLVRFDLKMTTPNDGATITEQNPVLSWKAYPGAETYDVALMPEFGSPLLQAGSEVSEPTITVEDDLLNCGYSWWVEAYNDSGVQIGESPGHYQFRVEGQDASCYVEIVSPANNEKVSGTGVTLKWKEHPLAASYSVQVWPDNDSSNMIVDNLEVQGTSLTIDEKLDPGKYVYFVTAIDATGNRVGMNPTRYFIVR